MMYYLNNENWISQYTDPMYLITCGHDTVLYKLIDVNEVVYIGKTTNGARRVWEQSAGSGKMFDNVQFIKLKDGDIWNEIEALLIRHYRPKYNDQHNPNYPRDCNIEDFFE